MNYMIYFAGSEILYYLSDYNFRDIQDKLLVP